MSQVYNTAQEKTTSTIKKENDCRVLQRKLGPNSAFKTQQELYRERWDNIDRAFIARSLESMRRQPEMYSFIPTKYTSVVFIPPTRPESRNRSPNSGSWQKIKACGTGGMLQLRRPSMWQNIPPLGAEAPTYPINTSAVQHALGQTLRVTTLPGFELLRTQGQTPPYLPPKSATNLPRLSQPESTQNFLGYLLMDGVGQLPEGDGGRDEGRGRGHECNRPASGSSRTNLQTGTRHSSHKELDIINIHASPSGDSWSFNGTGSASPNSQHGCDLANEEDYVVGEAFDCENDWDDCGMSSSED